MAQLMRTSNPALSGDTFRTGEATFGESMTVSGTVNKTGILLICCVATAAWTWNRFFNAPPEEAMQAMGAGARHRRHWRLHRRHRHHLQEGVGRDHRADLRVAGGPGAGRNLRHAGAAISRHRHPSRLADFWHAAGYVARLSFRPHQGDRQAAAGHCGGHRRHCRLLSAAIHPGILRRALHARSTVQARLASVSA